LMTSEEFVQDILKNKEKYIGKLILTDDNWVAKILDVNGKKGLKVQLLYKVPAEGDPVYDFLFKNSKPTGG
jgi:hypothetical protein